MGKLTTLAAVLLSLAACTVLDESDSDSDPDQGAPCPEAESPEACSVIAVVNSERADQGVPELRFDPALTRAAQAHAADMVARNYFSHDSPEGSDFSDRAAAADYQGFATGENIAQGQRSVQEVMTAWMNSAGHRRNILSTGSNEIGVGIEQRTWVQVFGNH
ncbi:MAG TPA: CAP domain-containing protein [Polyangiaceae bacterium]|nr:CAP domain-containing protein [Polyangiaceae bacterium]